MVEVTKQEEFFNAEEKEQIEAEKSKREDTEWAELYDQIIEKAKFLIKLQAPNSSLFAKESSLAAADPVDEVKEGPPADWKESLDSWKQKKRD